MIKSTNFSRFHKYQKDCKNYSKKAIFIKYYWVWRLVSVIDLVVAHLDKDPKWRAYSELWKS
jgi:hypothetical protein